MHDGGPETPTMKTINDAAYESNELINLMKFMHDMAHHRERKYCDCMCSLITQGENSYLKIALEVMKMSPNKKQKDGNTALHTAMSEASPFALELLLDNGADPFRCNDDGYFPMNHHDESTRNSRRCLLLMDTFIKEKIDRERCELRYLVKAAEKRFEQVRMYRFLIDGLLRIDTLKNQILSTVASNDQPFTDLKGVKDLLHQLDPLAEYFDYTSVPGVTKLDVDPQVQEWYVIEELSKLNWSKDIDKYFALGVARMSELHDICKRDPSRWSTEEQTGKNLSSAMYLLTINGQNRGIYDD